LIIVVTIAANVFIWLNYFDHTSLKDKTACSNNMITMEGNTWFGFPAPNLCDIGDGYYILNKNNKIQEMQIGQCHYVLIEQK